MKFAVAIGLIVCWLTTVAPAAADPAIIPQPQKMEGTEGAFKLTPNFVIASDAASKETGKYLAERLRKAMGYSIKVRKATGQTNAGNATVLTTEGVRAELGTKMVPDAQHAQSMVFPRSFAITLPPPASASVFYRLAK